MKVWISAAMVAAAALAGCGGGGSSSPAAGAKTAAGLWTGQTTDNRATSVLVLSDGNYYAIYSPEGDASTIEGVVHGRGSERAGAFDGNGYDYNLVLGIYPVTLQSDFVAGSSLNGAISYAGGTKIPFQLTYSPESTTPASMDAIASVYRGVVASKGGQQATEVSITAAGKISANVGDCTMSGTISARSDVNAYDVSLSFGAEPCYYAGQTLNGVAYLDAATGTAYAMAGDNGDGVLFVGSKQY